MDISIKVGDVSTPEMPGLERTAGRESRQEPVVTSLAPGLWQSGSLNTGWSQFVTNNVYTAFL